MIELQDQRVLGAIRWVDAVTRAPITRPLTARSDTLQFRRNLSGLTVITFASDLAAYAPVFDLADLPPSDTVPPGTRPHAGVVEDPSGTYQPTRFTLTLPRDPSPALLPPDQRRPANSLFTPLDIALLPGPTAPLPPGCAQVRVLIEDDQGRPLRHALARVVAAATGTVLGCGLSDARGETLVGIPGLRHFAPGDTEDSVVTTATIARLEIVRPPAGAAYVDWTQLRDTPVTAGHTDPQPLQLRPGVLISRRFPFTT